MLVGYAYVSGEVLHAVHQTPAWRTGLTTMKPLFPLDHAMARRGEAHAEGVCDRPQAPAPTSVRPPQDHPSRLVSMTVLR
jgi:hypothetical protein